MPFDGTLKFDTAIDQSGFKAGLDGLGSIAKAGMTAVTAAVGAATGAALVVVGISLLETAGGLDFTPVDFLPVASMWLVSIFMYDYVGGIVIGMFVYMFISILRAIFEKDKHLIPGVPVWVMTALMSLYYIF